MKINFLSPFESKPYFTIEEFRQVNNLENPGQARSLLYQWVKAGHILRLKRGVYMHHCFHDQHARDIGLIAAISAIIVPQSYTSLHFVLQRRNILTEATYPVTCITTKTSWRITNQLGWFWYRHIRPELYHGFTISEYYGIHYREATLAKALFDFMYLRPLPAVLRSFRYDVAEELRLNLDEFSFAEREEFAAFVEASDSLKMKEILANFQQHIWRS